MILLSFLLFDLIMAKRQVSYFRQFVNTTGGALKIGARMGAVIG
jgi:hypothetical protein